MRPFQVRRLAVLSFVLALASASCTAQTGDNAATSSAARTSATVGTSGAEPPPIVTDFSSLVRAEGATVVHISTTAAHNSNVTQLWPPPGSTEDPFLQFFRQFSAGSGLASGMASTGLGSGFIISQDGDILTSSDVVAGAAHVWVTLHDGRRFAATVVGADPAGGIALLKIRATALPFVKIGTPSNEKAGQWVASIGSPYGLENTVTAGIISNMSRVLPSESYIPLIQTDMSTNAGDAGSPVFNLQGEVIGIEAPGIPELGNVPAFTFAIPVDEAMKIVRQLRLHHTALHGHLGVTIQEVTGPLAQSFGLASPAGALVSAVDPRGPGKQAGLRPGDVILKLNGIPVGDSAHFPEAVADQSPGRTAKLTIWRNRAAHTTEVVLGSMHRTPGEIRSSGDATVARDGVTVRGMTSKERLDARVSSGVLVEKSIGPAAFAGIKQGDIILMVNSTPVSSPDQFQRKIDRSGNAIALLVDRNGQDIFVTIDLG
ncbi:trypsin-like peptidase domain-containing protein [Paraburkholderia sp. SIMBA_049]